MLAAEELLTEQYVVTNHGLHSLGFLFELLINNQFISGIYSIFIFFNFQKNSTKNSRVKKKRDT